MAVMIVRVLECHGRNKNNLIVQEQNLLQRPWFLWDLENIYIIRYRNIGYLIDVIDVGEVEDFRYGRFGFEFPLKKYTVIVIYIT